MTTARLRLLLAPFAAAAALLAAVANAHEVRPAYLSLSEQEPGAFDVVWKRPARGDRGLSLEPVLSGHSDVVGPVATRTTEEAIVQTWRLNAPEPLRGRTLRIRGLEDTLTDALVHVAFADGTSWTQRLTAREPRATLPQRQSGWQVARQYTSLGAEHIALGVDHLLFVLALLLVVDRAASLVKTVTAFTLAHSVTLGAAALGWARVPQQPVEAVIALSIVCVAAEIARAQPGAPRSLVLRAPWAVAFGFGLLHGFGFAGALAEIGLPQGHVPLALASFNVGVEIGQLLFVACAWAVLACARWVAARLPRLAGAARPLRAASAYAIGSVATFWIIERVAAF